MCRVQYAVYSVLSSCFEYIPWFTEPVFEIRKFNGIKVQKTFTQSSDLYTVINTSWTFPYILSKVDKQSFFTLLKKFTSYLLGAICASYIFITCAWYLLSAACASFIFITWTCNLLSATYAPCISITCAWCPLSATYASRIVFTCFCCLLSPKCDRCVLYLYHMHMVSPKCDLCVLYIFYMRLLSSKYAMCDLLLPSPVFS